VRYAETDQMGVVYYANYLVWFEIGRVEVLRTLGFSYRQLEAEHGCILPVAEARSRYKAPARYDDRIVIEARPALLRGSILKFAYNIYCEETEGGTRALLAEGETTHFICDNQMKRKRLPAHYEAALRSLIDSGDESAER
jgi:acyl-CoA thioester hydrolase